MAQALYGNGSPEQAANDQQTFMQKVEEKSAQEVSKLSELYFDSKIIQEADVQKDLLNLLPDWASKLTLLYRGSARGFTAQSFHSICDHDGPTLTLIKSNFNKIFGAFTEIPWSSSNELR